MLPSLDGAFYRRLAVTAAALAVFRLGCASSAAGPRARSSAKSPSAGGAAVGRLSLFALGIIPLLNALILAELLKIVAPAVRRWELAAPAQSRSLPATSSSPWRCSSPLLQGAGMPAALEDVSGLVPEPGTAFPRRLHRDAGCRHGAGHCACRRRSIAPASAAACG